MENNIKKKGKKKIQIDESGFVMLTDSHAFNISVACLFKCSDTATIINDLMHWRRINMANETNNYDDNYWTFMTVKAWQLKYPYMTLRQIDGILSRLIDNGYIVSGNYNNIKYDRKKWYALTEKASHILGFPFHIMGNGKHIKGNDNSHNGNTITDDYSNNYSNNLKDDKKENPDDIIDNVPPKSKGKRINGKDAMKSFFDKDDEVFQKFDNPALMFENWEVWLQYKNENKKSFKSATSEKIGIKQLAELSNTIAQNAVKIIETSIASGWQGLFEPKGKFTEPQKLPENKEILTASEEYKLYEKIKTRLSLRECTDEQIMILLKYEPYNQEILKQIEIRKERKTWTL